MDEALASEAAFLRHPDVSLLSDPRNRKVLNAAYIHSHVGVASSLAQRPCSLHLWPRPDKLRRKLTVEKQFEASRDCAIGE